MVMTVEQLVQKMNEWQGKPKYSEETCPSAALSITDPTLFDQGSKPGYNRLRYGMAIFLA
jgi:hypothetical protein